VSQRSEGPFDLSGQVAAVTGATGKLGPIWVDALVAAGARVAALDLPAATPTALYEDVAARAGDGVQRIDIDVTQRDSIEAAAAAVHTRFGAPATILVNNAGIDQPPDSPGQRHHLHELPLDNFRRMVEVNLLGTFQVIQVFGERMAAAGGGSIINIGSLYASVSPDAHFYDHNPGNAPFIKTPAYGASKAGVVSLSKFFATHWAGRGVRVNTLSPGGEQAGQHPEFQRKYNARVPLARMAEADDLKGPLVFLASRASAYVTGHELRVDGGFTAW
jgi:NAD(P)-dependent dehydrogenase (short-subunit alcohol dehydrogenase family)